jgi:hypothetical protein
MFYVKHIPSTLVVLGTRVSALYASARHPESVERISMLESKLCIPADSIACIRKLDRVLKLSGVKLVSSLTLKRTQIQLPTLVRRLRDQPLRDQQKKVQMS